MSLYHKTEPNAGIGFKRLNRSQMPLILIYLSSATLTTSIKAEVLSCLLVRSIQVCVYTVPKRKDIITDVGFAIVADNQLGKGYKVIFCVVLCLPEESLFALKVNFVVTCINGDFWPQYKMQHLVKLQHT